MSKVKYFDGYCMNGFDTFEEAVESSKNHSARGKMDVNIYKIVAIARYPFPEIKIENLESPDLPAEASG